MSNRKSAKKPAPPGEFIPSQFASCIEKGLDIHSYSGVAQTDGKKSAIGDIDENNDDGSSKPSARSTKSGSLAGHDNHDATINNTRNDNNPLSPMPPVECTNGAMEALRLCHSTFLSATANSLAFESSLPSSNTAPKKGKKSNDNHQLSKLLSENDVMKCMTEMGFSNLAQRAMASMSATAAAAANNNDNDGIADDAQNNTATRKQTAAKKRSISRKRKKNPFDGFDGSQEELLAEQERLLEESARRMRERQEEERKKT